MELAARLPRPATRPHARRLILSLAVLLAAFWLRFYALAEAPFGWHVDESAHGLEARDLLRGQALPVFFSQFTGHEALYTYLEAGAFALFGESVFAGRLVAALAGLLTVALTLPLGQLLWPGARGRRTGQWAALLLAVSLWHIIESRNGYRAILQPLVQLPALIFLLQALRATARRQPRAWLAWGLAGFFVGLNIHTYLASRAFPVVFVGLALLALWRGPERLRQVQGLALALGVAALVILPLAIHFYQRPIDFYGRGVQVFIWTSGLDSGNPWGMLWRNLRLTAEMFMSRGDPTFKHNVAYRPVFDLALGALFWGGVAYAVVGVFRRQARFFALALLGWLGVMLLPMVLSAQEIPSYLRAIGALPAVMFFPAMLIERGWAYALQFLEPRLRWSQARLAWLDLAWLVPFLWLTLSAQTVYMRDWDGISANDSERQVQMFYLEQDLRATWQGEPLYLATAYPVHVTLAFINPPMYEASHGFTASQALPLPPEGQPANYYYLMESTNARSDALWQKAGLELLRTGLSRFGLPAYEVYRWEGRWPQPAFTTPLGWSWDIAFPAGWQPNPLTAPINFNHTAALQGYDLTQTTAAPGETVTLTLFWQLPGPAAEDYSMFAHLLDAESQVVTQSDGNLYPATRWGAGELLLSSFPLQIPEGTPPGTYQLEIGLYKLFTGERLFILQGAEPVADRLLLQPITIR